MLVQRHTRDLYPEKQSPRRYPALWAIVTTDLHVCIRQCRAPSSNATPVTTFDEQPPHNICF